MVRNFKNDPLRLPAWEHSSESGSLYLRALYRYHVIIFISNGCFWYNQICFFFPFFSFLLYTPLVPSLPLFFLLLILSLSFSIRKQHIYIFFSLSHISSPSVVRANWTLSLVNYCVCVRRLSPRPHAHEKRFVSLSTRRGHSVTAVSMLVAQRPIYVLHM